MDNDQRDFFQSCLSQYTYAGSKIQRNSLTKHHGLFIKKAKRMRIINTGSFSLSMVPITSKFGNIPRMCTWVRMRFAERKSSSPVYRSTTRNGKTSMKVLRLLKAFSGKKSDNRYGLRHTRRTGISYQWFDFFVAVAKLDPYNENVAKQQLEILTKYLKNHVMGRRQYPVILMADFGWEYNSCVFDELKKSRWLENAFETSSGQYPAVTLLKGTRTKGGSLVDFILGSKFKSLLAATITHGRGNSQTNFLHRPVLSAVLRKRTILD